MHKAETEITIHLSKAQTKQLEERGYTFVILPDTGEIKKINYEDLTPVYHPKPTSQEELFSEIHKAFQELEIYFEKISQEPKED